MTVQDWDADAPALRDMYWRAHEWRYGNDTVENVFRAEISLMSHDQIVAAGKEAIAKFPDVWITRLLKEAAWSDLH